MDKQQIMEIDDDIQKLRALLIEGVEVEVDLQTMVLIIVRDHVTDILL